MRILGIGTCGRELAIQWALGKHPTVEQKWIEWDARNPRSSQAKVFAEAVSFRPDFAVVWTQVEPLTFGIADSLEGIGIPTVGPDAFGAKLEGSKSYAYQFAQQNGILVPEFRLYSDTETSKRGIRRLAGTGEPLPVLKPDGLPAGRGVRLPVTALEALDHVDYVVQHYGVHLHQKRVYGREFSVIVLTDGESFKLLPTARIIKCSAQGARPANCVGAVSPAPELGSEIISRACAEVVEPTLKGMRQLGHPYKGFLYIDMILDAENRLYLLDYNCRLAYPETEVILSRMVSNFAELLSATAAGKLSEVELAISREFAACVILLAEGYPGPFLSGGEVSGIDEARKTGCLVFPVGVSADSRILGNTGRIALVVGLGNSAEAALAKAYEGVGRIKFDGMWYGDIPV